MEESHQSILYCLYEAEERDVERAREISGAVLLC